MILSPSLLSADVGNLAAELSALEAAGLRWVHWDVMDGRFVPNITFGQHVIRQLRKRSGLFFDVHLMIVEPENYLSEFQAAGADMLVVHAEATRHLQRTLAEIRRLGMKAGVALNPATPLSALEYVLEDVDMILLMSVNPGFGGQKFLPITYEKIRRLRRMLDERRLENAHPDRRRRHARQHRRSRACGCGRAGVRFGVFLGSTLMRPVVWRLRARRRKPVH